jgi:hypothetical protein
MMMMVIVVMINNFSGTERLRKSETVCVNTGKTYTTV